MERKIEDYIFKQRMPNGDTLSFHFHKCPNRKCGYRWRHAEPRNLLEVMLGFSKEKNHDCPKCGTKQLEKDKMKKRKKK
jgi:hypothetical protein